MRKRFILTIVPALAALFLLQPLPAAASGNTFFQDDTLVIRKGRIDIERGILSPGADTVIVQIDSAALFRLPEMESSGIFTPLDNPVRPVDRLTSFEEALASGDALRRQYDFRRALSTYEAALGKAKTDADRLESGLRIVMARNGLTLSESCRIPSVIAKQRFSLDDFYQFYPLENGSWRSTPNELDPGADDLVRATYFPRNATAAFFSKADDDGFRNIYYTESSEKVWTYPQLVDEHLLSEGNEIYPMLSPDGQTLYFASDGLYGMGGYDLYYSVRGSNGAWSEPVNMGFPYSSPGDDFLLIDTPDGKYTLFASNRECSADSVYIYVLDKSRIPQVQSIQEPAALQALCHLAPAADPTRIDTASAISDEIPDNDNTRLYQEKSAEVSRLRDSVYNRERALDALRKDLAAVALPEAREMLAGRIAQAEEALAPFKSALSKASEEVQTIEMDFLRRGVDSRVRRTADREVVGARSGYVFAKKPVGPKLSIRLNEAPPDETEDFYIAPVGHFSTSNTLPDGVVYQIHLFSRATHASVEDLGGLSPVYERLTTSLQFTYAVGLFRSYTAALERLGTVRRLGFPEACIIAFIGGRPVDVSVAREAEAYATSQTSASR